MKNVVENVNLRNKRVTYGRFLSELLDIIQAYYILLIVPYLQSAFPYHIVHHL